MIHLMGASPAGPDGRAAGRSLSPDRIQLFGMIGDFHIPIRDVEQGGGNCTITCDRQIGFNEQ